MEQTRQDKALEAWIIKVAELLRGGAQLVHGNLVLTAAQVEQTIQDRIRTIHEAKPDV